MTCPIKREDGRLTGAGGIEIYWRRWSANRVSYQRCTPIVIAHGYAEHGERYQRLAARLLKDGGTVLAIDHRGHGRSGGPRGFIDRFDHAVGDLDQVVELARASSDTGKVCLLGHSLGGALALEYALHNQEKLAALVLSGPAVSTKAASPVAVGLARLLSAQAPHFGVTCIDPVAISRDPKEVERYASDPLNYHGKLPARVANEALKLIHGLPARLGNLAIPLLIQHGGADSLASVSGSEMVIHHFGTADRRLLVYPELRHEIYNELPHDRRRVINDLIAWLKRRHLV